MYSALVQRNGVVYMPGEREFHFLWGGLVPARVARCRGGASSLRSENKASNFESTANPFQSLIVKKDNGALQL